ncbi:MAG: hypothetical protein JWO68_3974, partial [Actinomycetia bacterium]|nr:hypothetical protein [Actinomycetes bacterium]
YRKPAGAVISEVEKKLKTNKVEESFLYELSGILLSHEKSSPAVIEKLLQSPDFRWRAWGTHLAGLWSSNLSDPLSYIKKSMTDTNARVRMEAVVAASHVPKSEAVKLATLVLDQSSDPEIDYALTLCIHALAPYWRPDLASGKLDFGDRFDALARVVSTMGDTNLVAMLRHKLESGKVTGPAREKLLSVMVENGGIQEMIYAQQEAPQSSLVLDSLVKSAERRKKETSPALLQALFVTSSPASRVAGARIAASWGDSAGQLTKIESMVSNTASTDAEKESGVLALAKLKHKAAWNEILPLSTHPSPNVRLAALSALAGIDPQAAAVESSKILARATSPSQAGIAISPFLNINSGSLLLSVALQKQSISPQSATAALQWLSNNGRDDFLLVDVLRKAAGLDFNHLEYSEKLVRDLVDDAQKLGDAKAGFQVLHRGDLACLGCHRIGSEGGVTEGPALAPELTAIGRAATPETIVESVLWPKRQVKEGFLLTQIKMKDGSLWQGYKESESQSEFQLRGVDGTKTTLKKTEIKERSDVGTLMPDGLTDALSPTERRDLLRYLMELGRN